MAAASSRTNPSHRISIDDLPVGSIDSIYQCFFTTPRVYDDSFVIFREPEIANRLGLCRAVFDQYKQQLFFYLSYIDHPNRYRFYHWVHTSDEGFQQVSCSSIRKIISDTESLGSVYIRPEQTRRIDRCFRELFDRSRFVPDDHLYQANLQMQIAPPMTYLLRKNPNHPERLQLVYKTEKEGIQSQFLEVSPEGWILLDNESDDPRQYRDFSQVVNDLHLGEALVQKMARDELAQLAETLKTEVDQ